MDTARSHHDLHSRIIMRASLLSLLGAVALVGCSSSTGAGQRPDGTPPYQSFSYPPTVVPTGYQATVSGQPGTTAVGVRLTNGGSTPATVEHGACSVAVWLYREDMPGAPPVWQNRLPDNVFCVDIGLMKTLASGESYDVPGATLGVSQPTLPTARYLVRVALKHRVASAATTSELIVLDAGTIALAR